MASGILPRLQVLILKIANNNSDIEALADMEARARNPRCARLELKMIGADRCFFG